MQRLSPADLMRAEYTLQTPFRLTLGIGDRASELECQQVLRWLPGRRLVARIRFSEPDGTVTDAVLKLFLGARAGHYRRRELAGMKRLARAEIRAPDLLARLDDAPQQALGLVFRFVPDSHPLQAEDPHGMELLVETVARLHLSRLRQKDHKLENFLLARNQIWLVDGDGIVAARRPLNARSSIADLAAQLAEQPPHCDENLPELGSRYCAARGWQHKTSLQQMLVSELQRARLRRLTRYAKKTRRSCSEFAVAAHAGHRSFLRRDWQSQIWEVFNADPERVVNNATVIKAGNSATVVRWQPQKGPSLVIKRYNVKSIWHGLRKAISPQPRYRRAWTSGQLLDFLAIPTARPLALLEWRRGIAQTVAYLVMPDLGERSLQQEIAENGLSLQLAAQVARLFVSFRAAGLRHGDAKASNFLLYEERLYCVDLDALALDRDGWRRDVARFLENWDGDVRRGFEKAFADLQLLP